MESQWQKSKDSIEPPPLLAGGLKYLVCLLVGVGLCFTNYFIFMFQAMERQSDQKKYALSPSYIQIFLARPLK